MLTNIKESFNKITDYWSPLIVSEVNDSYVKIAKVKGDFVKHTHDKDDELFYVIKGQLTITYDDKKVIINENELHTVKKGLSHFPQAQNETWIMLIEKKSTKHTGNTESELSKSIEEQMF